ncbi:hypothetical protein EZV62_011214 [Acer yangbiense]|uniref:cinnamyl-alcohol dehydrogenase n=1 Tax=Acer yangbiense TaxID=1000413 RepID=A0A5C7I4N6_9ROSI|nr:hypothetical protein EZV62_011214 [Acer yangbiense]
MGTLSTLFSPPPTATSTQIISPQTLSFSFPKSANNNTPTTTNHHHRSRRIQSYKFEIMADSIEEAPRRRTTTTGWAARDSSGVLSPYTYTLRKTGTEDVLIKVLFCGVCHTDLFNVKNHFGITRYPAVPGFVVKIPEGMVLEQAAPLLCAGVTVYSPLSHFGLNKSGVRGGILGLGGVGHMGVKIAKAMGHHVTVISSSDKKKVEAMEHLGADEYLVSSDATRVQEAADSLDYILDTVPAFHPLEPYLSLLGFGGKLILIGASNAPLQFVSPMLLLGRRSIIGSFIGSMKEAEEMLEFCKEKGLSSMIEVIKMDYINTAFQRLENNDVKYRFVVDVAGSELQHQ